MAPDSTLASAAKSSPIATQSKACLQLFESLSDLITHNDAPIQGITQTQVLDYYGQLRVWASNIGALQPRHTTSSLDYRLRDAPKFAAEVASLLEDLAETLEDVYAIASGEREDRSGTPILSLGNLDDCGDSPTVSDTNRDNSIEAAEEGQEITEELDTEELEPISELHELLESIPEMISRLFKISVIIRTSSSRDRFAKALTAGSKVPIDPRYDIDHVQNKFPRLRQNDMEWLRSRLGTAITQRRQYLRYCRDHREKMAKVADAAVGTQDAGTDTEARLSDIRDKRPLQVTGDSKSQASKQPSTLAPTTASTVNPSQLEGLDILERLDEESNDVDNRSVTSYASSVGESEGNNRLSVIQFEEIATPNTPFECPYCWTIQKINGHHAWKKHVMTDLKPYVCMGETCDSKLFADSRTWLTHELQNHLVEWQCCFCSRAPFSTLDKFQSHIVKTHGIRLGADQLSSLSKTCKKPVDQIVPSACLICDTWEETLRTLNQHISDDETLVVTPQQFRHHVRGHMEQLALFAIPRGCREDEDGESGKQAQGGTHASSERSIPANSGTPEYTMSEIAARFDAQTMAELLDQIDDGVKIAEEVVVAAAGNPRHGKEVMELLLDRRGSEITITEEVANAAAANDWNGQEVMGLLLDRREDQISITKELVEAAAGNMACGKEVMALLLERRGHDITYLKGVAAAVARGFDKDVLKRLLDRWEDELYMTEEMVEAVAGNMRNGLEVMALLLDRLKDADLALCWAATYKNEALVEFLLERGANIEAEDEQSQTPLSSAAEKGREAIVKSLLEKGANTESKDKWGQTPLSWATENGHEAVVKLLLENGADIDTKNILHLTPLSRAAANGHEAIVKLLLENGADIEARDKNGRTPLSWAAANGHEATVKLLLANGADIEAKDAGDMTSLSRATENGYEATVKLLLDNGADAEVRDKGGQTPLSYAAEMGHKGIVKLLLEHGADVKVKDEGGRTPLSTATARGYEAIVKLLQPKPDSVRNDQSPTPDHTRTGSPRAPSVGKAFCDLNVDDVAPQHKKCGQDWHAIFNPQVSRVLDVDLVYSLPHEGLVYCVKFSPDGKYLATGSNQAAQIFIVQTGQKACVLNHRGASETTKDCDVRCLCFGPDGRYLATGSEDRLIRVWHIETRTVRNCFLAHEQQVFCVDFAQDGRTIASGSGDRTVRLWDIEQDKCTLTLVAENVVIAVAISPDARFVAAGCVDDSIRVWDIKSGSLIYHLDGPEAHQDSVYSVAFSPDSKYLVSGSWDRAIKMWELSVPPTGSRPSLQQGKCVETFKRHGDYIYSVAFSPDARWLLSGGEDRTVQFWDVQTGTPQLLLRGHKQAVVSVAASPVGGYFATGSVDHQTRIWSYGPN